MPEIACLVTSLHCQNCQNMPKKRSPRKKYFYVYFPFFKSLIFSPTHYVPYLVVYTPDLSTIFVKKKCWSNHRTRRTLRTSPRWSSTKKVRATQNFMNEKWPEGSVYFLGTLQKSSKLIHRTGKTSFLENYSENVQVMNFVFLHLSKNCARVYRHFHHFVLNYIFCSSCFIKTLDVQKL